MMPTTPQTRRVPRADQQSPRRHSHTLAQRGTALIMVPTMMLVLLTLGGIAIDLSVMHLSHRTIHRVVSAAADDAAGMIDTRQIQVDGSVQIDGAKAARAVGAHLKVAALPGSLRGEPEVLISNDGTRVTVRVVVEVRHILLQSIPGVARSELITVVASARILP